MDDALSLVSLPDDSQSLKRMIVDLSRRCDDATRQRDDATRQRQEAARDRDAWQIKFLRAEVELLRLRKWYYGRKADQLATTADLAQMLLGFAEELEARPVDVNDVPPAELNLQAVEAKTVRRVRRGRRNLSAAAFDQLPTIRQEHDLPEDQKTCPCCGELRQRIGQESSWQIEYIPGHFERIEHVRHKYACRHCEQDALSPNIELADKPSQPIDKGLAGPGLLAYIVTSKFSDYRVQGEAVSQMRGGLSWSGNRARPQTSPSCGGQEPSWETLGANGATGSRQVRSAKSNASEPLMTCRK
jgi:transposase